MLEIIQKIMLELEALQSRTEEVGETFCTEWERVEIADEVQSSLFQDAQWTAEDAAQHIEQALIHLERILKNRPFRNLYE
jgi:hypothetical protein